MEIKLVIDTFQSVTFLPVTFLSVLTLPFVESRFCLRSERQDTGEDISVIIGLVGHTHKSADDVSPCRFYVESRLLVAPRLFVLIIGHDEQQTVDKTV